ncbi:MAG: M23 family metallopeptidase [Bacilli bacterium]
MNNDKPIFPVKNFIDVTQGFSNNHLAIDLGSGGRTQEIIASISGRVVSVVKNYQTQDSTGSSYGNNIVIEDGYGRSFRCAHLMQNSINLSVGDYVEQGQTLGIMGTTGHSTGVHCHFEFMINKKKVNPFLYVYIYSFQEMGDRTKNYNILSYNQVKIVSPTIINPLVNQIILKVKLNVRTSPGLNSEIIGKVNEGEVYNYFDVFNKDNYDWYRIEENMWVAGKNEYLEVKNSIKEDTEMIDKLTRENEELVKLLKEKEDAIIFKFNVQSTSVYKIILNKGEVLNIVK